MRNRNPLDDRRFGFQVIPGRFLLCWTIFSVILLHAGFAQQLQVDNVRPRFDQDGKIVDAHDGRVIEFNGHFYWYGTAYGKTNGFQKTNRYVCYTSSDLKHWEFAGELLPDKPAGVYYRPHVIHHKKSNLYVLWYNWYPELWTGQFGVAVSERPEGPFKIVDDNVRVKHSDIGVGDFGLFVDTDEVAYLAYNTIQGHKVSIERLSPDYLSSTFENGGYVTKHAEAGSMFKRNGLYYLLTDRTCCFCNQGSGARVYISDNPLRGYKLTNNINRYPGNHADELIDGEKRNNRFVELGYKNGSWAGLECRFNAQKELDRIHVALFTGDREGQCGQVDNPRVHEPIIVPQLNLEYQHQGVWKPLSSKWFDVDSTAQVAELKWGLQKVKAEAIRLVVDMDSSYSRFRIAEVNVFSGRQAVGIARAFKINAAPGTPIIPAQQTHIMTLESRDSTYFIWMGDLWGSASDNIKGHDYQYWSAPLEFMENGWIKPMKWVDRWSVNLELVKEKTERPNIIFMVADDLGWADLGCYGNDFIETPNLDALAQSGIRFTDGYAAAPLCSPSRASVITGLSPARLNLTEHIHGHPPTPKNQKLITPRSEQGLPLWTKTIPEALNKAEYVTAHIGKWHLGGGEYSPRFHGFDHVFGGSWAGLPGTFHYPFFPGGAYPELRENSNEGDYLTDVLTGEAVRFIVENQDTNFFLNLNFYAPHVPIEGPGDLVKKYTDKRKMIPGKLPEPEYAAMVGAIDKNVGRVMSVLKELDLDRETLIVFTSDNGGLHVESVPAFIKHTPPTTNLPLADGKGYLKEGGIREPFIFVWPGKVPKGVVLGLPVSTNDLFNTAMDASSVRDRSRDGKSILEMIESPGEYAERELFWHFPHYSPQGGLPGAIIRKGKYKLIEWFETGDVELYDLSEDLSETNDISEKQPELTMHLLNRLHEWQDGVGAKMPTLNPEYEGN